MDYYTNFKWELVEEGTTTNGSVITNKDDTLTIKIKVTNIGDVAGKDVVQLYFSAPYIKTELKKRMLYLDI